MIIDAFCYSFTVVSGIMFIQEMKGIPSLNVMCSILMNTKCSNWGIYCFLLILYLIPFLLGVLVICMYKRLVYSEKHTLPERYSSLCSFFYYSSLISLTSNILFLLESLTESKTSYFIFRMGLLKGAHGMGVVYLYRLMMSLLLNSISFVLVFFFYETVLVVKVSTLRLKLKTYFIRNMGILSWFMGFLIVYGLVFYYFKINFIKHLRNSLIVQETINVYDFIWCMIINIQIGMYYIIKSLFL